MPAIAEPPTTVKEVAKPEPKPGELAASVLEQMMDGERPAKAKPEKKAETKPEAETATTTAAKPEPETKPETVKPKPTKPVAAAPVTTPEPDYEKIAEASARGVTQALKSAPEKKSEATDPLADLNDEEREYHEAFERMEKDFPAQYQGKLAARYLESLKAAEKWEQDWLDQHPGQELDFKSADYLAFEEKNAVKYNDLHLHKSLANMATEKQLEKAREKDSGKLKAIEARERLREETPKIIAHRAAVAREYFTALGEDYQHVLDTAGNINGEAIQKLIEADPIKSIAMTTANQVEAFAGELYSLSNGLAEFDPKNAAHIFIDSYVDQKEEAMKSLPLAKQINEKGQRFATASEYNQMSPETRRSYWRYNHKDLSYIFASEQAAAAKISIADEEKRIESIATRRGFVKAESKTAQVAPTAAAAGATAPATPLPASPSGAIEPRPALPNGQIVAPQKSDADAFSSMFVG